LGLLGVAVLGVIEGRGRTRAWWTGFLVFGSGYFVLAFIPWFTSIHEQLATAQALKHLSSWASGAPAEGEAQYFGLIAARERVVRRLDGAKRLARSSSDPAVVRLSRQYSNLNASIDKMSAGAAGAPNPVARALFLRISAADLRGLTDPEIFSQIGHSVFVLLAGLVGATAACRFHAKRIKAEPAR
jgi:hypothetical protein